MTSVGTVAAFGRMSRRDRDWILRQLSADERERLLALLDRDMDDEESAGGSQTEDAGFAVALEKEAQVHSLAPAADSKAAPVNDDPVAAVLASANAGHLAQLLRGENDLLVAALIFGRPWQWRGLLLDRLGVESRNRLLRLESSAREVKPVVVAALATAVAARLADMRASAPMTHDPVQAFAPGPKKRFGLKAWKT